MREQSMPRWINIAIGAWVFLSAFLWPHSGAQYSNALVIGAATVVTAAIGLRIPSLRYLNVALAIWLFVSSWFIPTLSSGTMWNNVIASIAILIAALQPSGKQMAAYR